MKIAVLLSLCSLSLSPLFAQEKSSPATESKETSEAKKSDRSDPVLGEKLTLKPNTNKIALTNLHQKAAYIMGVQEASTIMLNGGELLDPEIVIMGMRDVFGKHELLVPENQVEDIQTEFQRAVNEYEVEKKKKEAEQNKQRGLAFLEANKKKEGIKVTDTGLQYRMIQEGSGDSPSENDRVAVHFRSRTIDGFEFNNSYKYKNPISIPVKAQIKGWREALSMMKPGAKWELFVPPDLAYGSREVGRGVGPNSTLIFELELVRVEKASEK